MPGLDLSRAARLAVGRVEASRFALSGVTWARPAAAVVAPVVRSLSFFAPGFQTIEGAVDRPAGVVAGDLLVFMIALGVNDTGIITPAGFTRVLNVPSTSPPSSDGAIYVKVATSAEPASYSFQWTRSTRFMVSAVRVSGAKLPAARVAPFSVGDVASIATAPAITGAAVPGLLLDFAVLGNGLRTMTPAAGMSEVWQNTHNAQNPDRCTALIAQRNVAAGQVIAARDHGIAPAASWGVGSLILTGA